MSYTRNPRTTTGINPSGSKKTTSERNQKILKTLLLDPGNKYCADCKTTGHPRWASWSLGVFLCIRWVFLKTTPFLYDGFFLD